MLESARTNNSKIFKRFNSRLEMHRNKTYTSAREEIGTSLEKISLVGKDAKKKFYLSYRNLIKIDQKLDFKNLEESPFTAYIKATEALKIPPQPLGMIKNSGKETNFNL